VLYIYLVYLVRLFICLLCVNYVHSTCAECTSWLCYVYYVLLCYGRFGRRLASRISVPSLTLCHFVHLTNKRLVTCNLYYTVSHSTVSYSGDALVIDVNLG